MRMQDNPYLPSDMQGLVRQLDTLYRQAATQINGLSEGRIAAATNASTSPPTAGQWMQGDTLRNSAPVEEGSPAYVVLGWVCVQSGEPGDWREIRAMTGG